MRLCLAGCNPHPSTVTIWPGVTVASPCPPARHDPATGGLARPRQIKAEPQKNNPPTEAVPKSSRSLLFRSGTISTYPGGTFIMYAVPGGA